VSSSEPVDQRPLDFDRDVPTTVEDVQMLRRLRQETTSWLLLPTDTVEALIPEGALDRRPATPAHAQPFRLPESA
jgi:hypothetical protein